MVMCLGLVSCLPKPNPIQADLLAWSYSDLRALQAPGTVNAAQDLIALYTRRRTGELQVRIDLLDMKTVTDSDIYLALDLVPGSSTRLPVATGTDFAWDLLVVSPAGGRPYALNATGALVAGVINRVNRDALLDMVVVTLNNCALPGNAVKFSMLAFASAPGANRFASQIGPVQSDALPPGRARLLLEFWDTLPADSPAQALRRWDGAHTGPLGQRHGLRPLLLAAEGSRIPLVLLDLKQPSALSALDALGGLQLVQSLAEQRLLVLPDAAWGDPASDRGLELSRAAATAFKLPASESFYGPVGYPIPDRYQVVFTDLPGADRVIQWQGKRLVSLPGGTGVSTDLTGQPGREGPSLAMRLALLASAVSSNKEHILIQGGDLPHSTWGDSIVAENTMRYLAAHPWIQVLGESDLLTLPACQATECLPAGALSCDNGSCLASEDSNRVLRTRLQDSPTGTVTDIAWRLYLQLTGPQPNPELQQLRSSYLGQVSVLLEAAQWASRPYSRSDCQVDLNGDSFPECILSNLEFFGVFDTRGAILVAGFTRNAKGEVQQFTGSTAQEAVGLTDPSLWKLNNGMDSDPGVIPGAFNDLPDIRKTYLAVTKPDEISFTSQSGKTIKTFRLLTGGLGVSYAGLAPGTVRIPLIIGGDRRYSPGWLLKYHSQVGAGAARWGMDGALSVGIKSTLPLTITTFLDTGNHLQQSENPDWSYPPGHFMAFPLAVVDIQAEGAFSIELSFQP